MYHYNSTSESCENYIYGGCGGTANLFGIMEECEEKMFMSITVSLAF